MATSKKEPTSRVTGRGNGERSGEGRKQRFRPQISSLSLLPLLQVLLLCGSDTAEAKKKLALHSTCNWSKGYWHQEARDLPRYNGSSCPYVDSNKNCALHNRTNLSYQQLRWRPSGCILTRYTAARMAAKFPNQLFLVVGDSLAKNFYSSLACSLNSGRTKLVPGLVANTSLSGLTYPKANLSMAFIGSQLLVAATWAPNGVYGHTVNVAQVDPAWANYAMKASVIIFQSADWWFATTNTYYSNRRYLNGTSDLDAYAMGMNTVLRVLRRMGYWGRVIFLSVSPSHYVLPRGVPKNGSFCETNSPLNSTQLAYVEGRSNGTLQILSLQNRIFNVTASRPQAMLLDVTTMSLERPDAHMQCWAHDGGVLPPGNRDDCLHWCEAGVPDMWVEAVYNELLYAL
eukprot:TRINITY_DN10967_c0_g1_i1.p1 TRINITY_DN10967_c0_g1~~TRINITY_DN10967_c0_g1_i1.p1  ORF type:complete len:400 (+),score=50.52 TRINITY_DN10967_c0_g1_i1:329-1528(+)